MPETFDEKEERYRQECANREYTEFVKSGVEVGFTDEQVNWLWENCRRTWTTT